MDEETNKPVKTTDTAGGQEGEGTSTPTIEDTEARFAELEAEKNKAIEEAANWKIAALKSKKVTREDFEDETEDERIARIVSEKLAETKIAQIDAEKEALLRQTLKENKELKLAHLNKTDAPASMGTHSEGVGVKDTLVTPDQISAFKARGWSDKDIERYKKNLKRYA